MRKIFNRNIILIASAVISIILLGGNPASADDYHREMPVVIPFANANGWPNGPARIEFQVPGGTYYITLEVNQTPVDVVGVASVVHIGLEAYTVDTMGNYSCTGWQTNFWRVQTSVSISGDGILGVQFSTIAPLGAAGTLTVDRL